MNGISRILRRFTGLTIVICVFILILNYIILAFFVFNGMNFGNSPEKILKDIAEDFNNNDDHVLGDNTKNMLSEQQLWAMLIDKDGQVIWDYRLPQEIPEEYTLTDIAKLSRNYLKNYPVFIWEHSDGLIVVGYPKRSYAKYQYQFPVNWISALPLKILIMLIINIVLAVTLSIIIGTKLIKSVKPLISGIHNLAHEKPIFIRENGVFNDIANSINHTSTILQEKNRALKVRDEARSNWIAGISHDIRTPLSMVLGYASGLEENEDIPMEQRHHAGIIRQQGEKLSSLVSDLNLVSMLEYEMQPLKLKPVRLSKVIRHVVVDFLNNGLDERFVITMDIPNENIEIMADEKLLIRAVYNLVLNSIKHNPEGCEITIKSTMKDKYKCCFNVSDTGKGVLKDKLSDLTRLPYSSNNRRSADNGHGLGLPMVARIAKAHKGELILQSDYEKGFEALMIFPTIQ
ncbi:sensor histidine kinase [Vallitalea guaymasensis]|mgnify:CR=1 FL=1|uniref:sensor histidine kinase n=1 Tax=Vallitalea guaymasensis TaxID=1185412 RepID=UPI002355F451|nr:HAMP domain-containing sensor histidine kinase [Vallitalea guaymasensis]